MLLFNEIKFFSGSKSQTTKLISDFEKKYAIEESIDPFIGYRSIADITAHIADVPLSPIFNIVMTIAMLAYSIRSLLMYLFSTAIGNETNASKEIESLSWCTSVGTKTVLAIPLAPIIAAMSLVVRFLTTLILQFSNLEDKNEIDWEVRALSRM